MRSSLDDFVAVADELLALTNYLDSTMTLTLCPLRVYPCVTMRPTSTGGGGRTARGPLVKMESRRPKHKNPGRNWSVHCAGAPFSFSRVSLQLAQSVQLPYRPHAFLFRNAFGGTSATTKLVRERVNFLCLP